VSGNTSSRSAAMAMAVASSRGRANRLTCIDVPPLTQLVFLGATALWESVLR
jgi:hypothetical protein